uniref:Uncharacterized protein n=1 Tax=Triticum urartu TaxID=4572 RepID=A0A8R7UHP5_TRIUA
MAHVAEEGCGRLNRVGGEAVGWIRSTVRLLGGWPDRATAEELQGAHPWLSSPTRGAGGRATWVGGGPWRAPAGHVVGSSSRRIETERRRPPLPGSLKKTCERD